jgi:hypothetical protein
MDAFSFLSVLLSIILGLAITQVLQGLGRLMTARARVTFFWPPVVIALVMLVSFVQSWWAMFGLRNHAGWTFAGFFVVILQTIFSYLQAALILPEFQIESPVDMRANYFAHARWFFLMIIAGTLTSLAKDLVLDGKLPSPLNTGFHCMWIAMAAIACVTRVEWFHKLLALFAVAMNAAYIGLLFSHLQ